MNVDFNYLTLFLLLIFVDWLIDLMEWIFVLDLGEMILVWKSFHLLQIEVEVFWIQVSLGEIQESCSILSMWWRWNGSIHRLLLTVDPFFLGFCDYKNIFTFYSICGPINIYNIKISISSLYYIKISIWYLQVSILFYVTLNIQFQFLLLINENFYYKF